MAAPSSPAEAVPASILRGMAAAIATISVVGIGLALTIPLLSLELERLGVSGTVSGLQTAAQALGSILAALQAPRLIGWLGVRRLAAAMILVASLIVLALSVSDHSTLWFPLRFLLGGALSTLFVASEYWITGIAPAHRRGLATAIYATCLSIGFAIGPSVLWLTGTTGPLPYLAGAGLLLVGLLPVLIGGQVPAASDERPGSTMAALGAAPLVVAAALVFGAIESGAFTFLATWGTRIGFAPESAATLLTAMALGNVLMQVPIGLLADRLSKPHVLMVCAGASALLAGLVPAAAGQAWLLPLVLFLWGGAAAAIYTVGLAWLAERFAGEDLSAANAAFVVNYGLGMMIGPPLAGLGLDLVNPHGFLMVQAGFGALYALLVAVALARARGAARTP